LAPAWWKGSRLHDVRTRRHLTQAALAAKVGVHKMTISRLERGDRQPSMNLLQKLAKALKVKVAELV
jgi:transcriptional regulator with XRE-family HTH domain